VKIKLQNKIKFLTILTFLAICLLPLVICKTYAQDKIIAIVNSDIITQKDLNDFLNFMRIQLSAGHSGQELESRLQSIKLDLLDRLIEDRLILQEAKKNKLSVDNNIVTAKIDEIKKRYDSEPEFIDALGKEGLVQADLEKKTMEQLLMHNIVEIKIKRKIFINPTEVTAFYQENIEKFKLSEQREFESIAISDENEAREIFNGIKNGQDINELAHKYSLSISKFIATQGGELRKDIEDAVFRLSLKEISEPLKLQEVYYIFKLNNITQPHQQSLSEAQDKIYNFIFNAKMQEEMVKWLDDLKKAAYIKIMQE